MNVFNDTFTYPGGRTLSTVGYPHAPILWMTYMVDCVCTLPLRCSNWRSHFPESETAWYSETYKVPFVSHTFPEPLSYADFRAATAVTQQEEEGGDDTRYITFHSLYRYAFETPSTDLGSLNNWTAFCVMFVLAYCLRRLKSVAMPYFRSLGRQAATRTHGRKWVEENSVRISKFAEYVFRLVYHSAISVYGIWYFHDKQWWRTFDFFRGFPYQDIHPGMAWYYLLQAAYNLDAFLSLMELSLETKFQSIKKSRPRRGKCRWQFPIAIQWAPTVRGDFQEMFVHHVVTNALVVGSSYFRLTRIGSMIFLLHDVSDVPVDLSKLANFVKWKQVTIVCFGVMAVSWLITRLIILPFKVYRAILYEGYLTVERQPLILFLCWRYFFYIFVGLLIILHAAWFTMFVRMFIAIVTKNEVHDLTEHKNGEKDADHGDAKENGGSANGCKKER